MTSHGAYALRPAYSNSSCQCVALCVSLSEKSGVPTSRYDCGGAMLVMKPSFFASFEKSAISLIFATVKLLMSEDWSSAPSRSQSMPSKPFSKPGPDAALFHLVNCLYHSAPEKAVSGCGTPQPPTDMR